MFDARKAAFAPQRRRFLGVGAGAALVPLVGCGGNSMMSDGSMGMPLRDDRLVESASRRPLPVLPLDEGVLDALGRREFALRIQRGSAQLVEGTTSATLGYNGALLGPALRLRKGEATRISVRNDLDEVTTVHWHGLVVPAEADGGPHQPIAPGARWDALFEVVNPASTCWFHPHAHGSTGRQVVFGLAGLLVVEDPAALAGIEMPGRWGVDDLALVLQDKRFTAGGQIDYSLSTDDLLNGYAGDRLIVNGVAGPVWDAPAQWVRLRLLNGCNARALSLKFASLTMLQIANEGGLLAAPVARTAITLWPGERAEVLVDFSAANGQQLALLASTANAGMGSGIGMGMGNAAGSSEVTALVVRVNRPRQPGAMSAPPPSLPASPTVLPQEDSSVRVFALEGGMMSSDFSINGRRFDLARVDFAVPARRIETWVFENRTMMAHPMHVHGVRMSLIDRDGVAAAAHERGQRDTFVVEARRTATLAVQTPDAASPVPLMLHCHNLEHEGRGMMIQFIAQ